MQNDVVTLHFAALSITKRGSVMKICIFYFSGTGNTKWAAEKLNKLLNENSHSSELFAIETVNTEEALVKLQGADCIGFAYPIYLQNMPRIMRKFIKGLTDLIIKTNLDIKNVFFLNTFGYTNAYGVFKAKSLLKGINISTIGYINLKMTDSTKSVTGEEMPIEIIENSTAKLKRFIDKVKNNKKFINGVNPKIMIGSILSRIFEHILVYNYKNMKVNTELCSRCMKCIENCPVKCIQFKGNTFTFSSDCEACMRCIRYCPTHAITRN